MKRLALCVLLMTTAGACGKRSAAGTILGGGAGVAIGMGMDNEGNNTTLVAAGIGAAIGMFVLQRSRELTHPCS